MRRNGGIAPDWEHRWNPLRSAPAWMLDSELAVTDPFALLLEPPSCDLRYASYFPEHHSKSARCGFSGPGYYAAHSQQQQQQQHNGGVRARSPVPKQQQAARGGANRPTSAPASVLRPTLATLISSRHALLKRFRALQASNELYGGGGKTVAQQLRDVVDKLEINQAMMEQVRRGHSNASSAAHSAGRDDGGGIIDDNDDRGAAAMPVHKIATTATATGGSAAAIASSSSSPTQARDERIYVAQRIVYDDEDEHQFTTTPERNARNGAAHHAVFFQQQHQHQHEYGRNVSPSLERVARSQQQQQPSAAQSLGGKKTGGAGAAPVQVVAIAAPLERRQQPVRVAAHDVSEEIAMLEETEQLMRTRLHTHQRKSRFDLLTAMAEGGQDVLDAAALREQEQRRRLLQGQREAERQRRLQEEESQRRRRQQEVDMQQAAAARLAELLLRQREQELEAEREAEQTRWQQARWAVEQAEKRGRSELASDVVFAWEQLQDDGSAERMGVAARVQQARLDAEQQRRREQQLLFEEEKRKKKLQEAAAAAQRQAELLLKKQQVDEEEAAAAAAAQREAQMLMMKKKQEELQQQQEQQELQRQQQRRQQQQQQDELHRTQRCSICMSEEGIRDAGIAAAEESSWGLLRDAMLAVVWRQQRAEAAAAALRRQIAAVCDAESAQRAAVDSEWHSQIASSAALHRRKLQELREQHEEALAVAAKRKTELLEEAALAEARRRQEEQEAAARAQQEKLRLEEEEAAAAAAAAAALEQRQRQQQAEKEQEHQRLEQQMREEREACDDAEETGRSEIDRVQFEARDSLCRCFHDSRSAIVASAKARKHELEQTAIQQQEQEHASQRARGAESLSMVASRAVAEWIETFVAQQLAEKKRGLERAQQMVEKEREREQHQREQNEREEQERLRLQQQQLEFQRAVALLQNEESLQREKDVKSSECTQRQQLANDADESEQSARAAHTKRIALAAEQAAAAVAAAEAAAREQQQQRAKEEEEERSKQQILLQLQEETNAREAAGRMRLEQEKQRQQQQSHRASDADSITALALKRTGTVALRRIADDIVSSWAADFVSTRVRNRHHHHQRLEKQRQALADLERDESTARQQLLADVETNCRLDLARQSAASAAEALWKQLQRRDQAQQDETAAKKKADEEAAAAAAAERMRYQEIDEQQRQQQKPVLEVDEESSGFSLLNRNITTLFVDCARGATALGDAQQAARALLAQFRTAQWDAVASDEDIGQSRLRSKAANAVPDGLTAQVLRFSTNYERPHCGLLADDGGATQDLVIDAITEFFRKRQLLSSPAGSAAGQLSSSNTLTAAAEAELRADVASILSSVSTGYVVSGPGVDAIWQSVAVPERSGSHFHAAQCRALEQPGVSSMALDRVLNAMMDTMVNDTARWLAGLTAEPR